MNNEFTKGYVNVRFNNHWYCCERYCDSSGSLQDTKEFITNKKATTCSPTSFGC